MRRRLRGMFVGLGWRKPLAGWIASHPQEIECLEITAEHFFDADGQALRELSEHYPLFVHGLGLSLGTPGSLDALTLAQFKRVAQSAKAKWVSEHLAFTKTRDVDLGHLNPVLPTYAALEVLVDHVKQLAHECECPVILENITTELNLMGEIPETEFIQQLCEKADCGLLLDVTNLFINSQNHRFDPYDWFAELPAGRIHQLHVIGYGCENGHYVDVHHGQIQEDLWELIAHVIQRSPKLQAVTIEWDKSFPTVEVLSKELQKLRQLSDSQFGLHAP